MKKTIYLDNAATTKVSEKVIDVMNKYHNTFYANPSSSHSLGEQARKAINSSRTTLARELNAKASEIIFTSGATESNNLAILGLAHANANKNKIIISSIEHASVYNTAKSLQE